ncbi:MAG TPA: glutamine--fructose-6-phosphate transaminase (isomerizing) [Solirubrobacteraceae bacterium]|jgi:glucosamine--fructose-6-phosphate aminotransferase (isomerizing)|nr:glutamine--fructose-6-phosphate transaminase (isomerizing) [Solirubrobacteraceae bacterium]
MCGIVGYVGPRKVRPLLMEGLEKLEYRGYDSAGISVLDGDRVDAVRAVGNLSALRSAIVRREAADGADERAAVAVAERPGTGTGTGGIHTGIAHTRWATHGRVTEENAHPHYDTTDSVHIVVNGIVENYIALKARLMTEDPPAVFTSETDAEVIAHLVAHHYDGDLLEAVRAAYAELRGHYAFVALTAREPGVLVGARKECPLVVGRGDGETFIASAIPAFLRDTRRVQYIGDDELVVLRPEGTEFYTAAGEPVEHEVVEIDWDSDTAEKQGYETFMLKEIHEQADAVAETIGERAARGWGIDLGDLGPIDDDLLRRIRRVVIVACGTAYHAGLIGRYAIEQWARVPVEVDIASEYRYRDPVVGPDDLVIGVSQSGETADTLAAMRTARAQGATVLAVTNVMGAQATREADGVLYTRAGLEIGVAATKTFVSQITVMYLLALRLAEVREVMNRAQLKPPISDLKRLPHMIAELLEHDVGGVEAIAKAHYQSGFFLYLGRHIGLPVALEGALKLKEISYIATDAYAAGEMKHGPIALLDENTPVVVVATESPVLGKVISNIQEVRARGARVIAVATEGDETIAEHADEVIRVPRTDWMLAPLLAVIPLQLLAYHIARLRGLNVDQPRNLAKTVTVE